MLPIRTQNGSPWSHPINLLASFLTAGGWGWLLWLFRKLRHILSMHDLMMIASFSCLMNCKCNLQCSCPKGVVLSVGKATHQRTKGWHLQLPFTENPFVSYILCILQLHLYGCILFYIRAIAVYYIVDFHLYTVAFIFTNMLKRPCDMCFKI